MRDLGFILCNANGDLCRRAIDTTLEGDRKLGASDAEGNPAGEREAIG